MSDEPTDEEKTLPQEQVLLLPGHAFYVERLELPPGLEEKERPGYAQLSLETLAPFPVEQLNWGFLSDPDAGTILLYAAHRERLKQLGFENIEDYLWVFPDFLPLATARHEAHATILLRSEHAATLIQFSDDEMLPQSILARADRDQLPVAGDGTGPLVLRHSGTQISENGRPRFDFEPESADSPEAESDPWHGLKLPETGLWDADVRPPEFKTTERNRRQLASLVTRATAYAGYAALFLILLELCLLLGNAWLGVREAKIAEQLPEVRMIEDKQSLMNKLDQVAQNELRPIAILEALNKGRPEGIYFTSTVTEGRNRITVDGIATTISELNAYTEALQDSGEFEVIDSQQITRSGRITFTVTLDYIHDEESTEEQVE
ncbi:MAG: PilN domain-containing protein [Opitutales bacterium]